MKTPLRVLHLENDRYDAELVRETLTAEGFLPDVTRVETRGDFAAALEHGRFDLILATDVLPRFDGLEALALACAERPELPFLFVSGELEEKAALECLKRGATDYVPKTRLVRLGPCVRRALREVQQRHERDLAEAARFESEECFRAAFDRAAIGMALTGLEGAWRMVNPALCEMLGHTREELLATTVQAITHPDDVMPSLTALRQLIAGEIRTFQTEKRYCHKQGHLVWASQMVTLVCDAHGRPLYFVSQIQDITARKRVEAEIRTRVRQQEAVAQLGQRALAGDELGALLHQATELVASVLGVEFCQVMELLPDGHAFVLRAGVGWRKGLVGRATVKAGRASQAGYTLLADAPVIVEDLRTETRFTSPSLLVDHGVISGLSVIVGGAPRPFGVLSAHTARQRTFMRDDLNFLQAVGNVLATAIDRKRVEAVLAESQGRLQALFDNTLDAILLADNSARFVEVNPAACGLLGYSRDELLRLHLWEITPESHQEVGRRQWHLFLATGRLTGEYTVQCKDGTVRQIEFRAVANVLPGVHLAASRDVTERKLAEAGLRRASERLQTLSRRLLEVQETERRYIARELHDQIGQALTAVELNLQAVQHLAGPPELAPRLADSVNILDQVLGQVRDLSLALRPSMLDDLGLVPALRWYVQQQMERSGLRINLSVDPPDLRVDAAIETACFRVVQEALTNVVRHARARAVTVALNGAAGRLHLLVRDDGVGFDIAAAQERAARGQSLGLLGMEERVSLVGGRLEFRSVPPCGTEVHAWFPPVPSPRSAEAPEPLVP